MFFSDIKSGPDFRGAGWGNGDLQVLKEAGGGGFLSPVEFIALLDDTPEATFIGSLSEWRKKT